jgi:hypothetical protein
MPATITVPLGTGVIPATAVAPRLTIGFWESLGLTLRGWTDARRYGDVADVDQTHVLLMRNSVVRRREDEVVRAIDAALSRVDALIAEARVASSQVIPPIAVEPSATQLNDLEGRDRQDWVQSVRASRAAAARAARIQAEVDAATVRLAQLEAERQSILVEGEDVRRLWADAFEMRAARYTRARFGSWGRRPDRTPRVPDYRRGRDPHPVRNASTPAAV